MILNTSKIVFKNIFKIKNSTKQTHLGCTSKKNNPTWHYVLLFDTFEMFGCPFFFFLIYIHTNFNYSKNQQSVFLVCLDL